MTDATTEAELAVLARQAGLDHLPPAFKADLLSAWRHVEQMTARIRRPRAYADEPAHVFAPATFAPATGGQG